jgi:predicted phage terminase large subunit-like protein
MTSASEEIARRRAIRSSMAEWARACGYEPARHQRLLCEKLEGVARGEKRKLMFFLPPGSAKSTYCNLWVPWYMARSPAASVLGASHTTDLAERFSRRIRGLVLEHGTTLGIAVSDESQAASRWALASGGEYMAAGVGSAILGFRADVLLIDDPIRSRDEAFSATIRESVWEWFHSSARTRLRPGGAQILVMTRFHEDDLAARLLQQEDDWDVVNLPAEAESDDPLGRAVGEFLWNDDDYGYANALREQKKSQLPAVWSALFQGRPAPEQGDYFRAEWFKSMTAMPARDRLAIYGASDFAVSAGRGDFTVHAIVGLDPDGQLYLLDLWRKQASADEGVEAFCDLVNQWKPIGWAVEKGQLANAIEPFMRTRQRARSAWVAMETFPTKGDKSVRAQSIRGRLAVSGILVPIQVQWWPEVRAELLSFPAAKHDDCADALGLVGQILDKMAAPHVPAPKPPPKVLSLDPAIRTTVTMDDLWAAQERKAKRSGARIW